tara:strand:+ start:1572 stop:1871 length:300 start_codon:yes stop_codon:yes gene_type:complete
MAVYAEDVEQMLQEEIVVALSVVELIICQMTTSIKALLLGMETMLCPDLITTSPSKKIGEALSHMNFSFSEHLDCFIRANNYFKRYVVDQALVKCVESR